MDVEVQMHAKTEDLFGLPQKQHFLQLHFFLNAKHLTNFYKLITLGKYEYH